MRCVPSKRAYYQFAKFKRGFKNTGSCSMRYAPLLSFALLGLSGCVAPVPTSTTYVTPATTTTYTRPADEYDRHERAAWLSTGLHGTPTHHYGNSYPLVAVRAAQVAEVLFIFVELPVQHG